MGADGNLSRNGVFRNVLLEFIKLCAYCGRFVSKLEELLTEGTQKGAHNDRKELEELLHRISLANSGSGGLGWEGGDADRHLDARSRARGR